MKQSTQIIVVLGLILWIVFMGNLHLKGKIAHEERKYMDRLDFAIECVDSEVDRAESLHAKAVKATEDAFKFPNG